MENVGDIITQAKIDLKDPTFPGHFTKAMMYGWASEGQREICRRTHCLRKETVDISSLLVVDTIQQLYSTLIPDDNVIGIFSVHCEDTQRAFNITSIPELDRDNSSWRARSGGTPWDVFPGPNDTLGFTPAPDSTWISDHELYIIYSSLPTQQFSNDSDIPVVDEKAWDYIKDFCVLRAKAEDREFASWDRLWVMWKEGLAFMKAEPEIIVKGKVSYIKPRGGVQLNPP